jgi:cytochrome c peroxidase
LGGLCGGLLLYGLGAAQAPQTQPPSGKTYFPVVEQDFASVRASDQGAKPAMMQRQRRLLAERYDLGNRPAPGVMMAGGRKAVQQGVRVKLPASLTWEQLAAMSPDEIRDKDLFPKGLLPLPHVKHVTGGMVFPTFEIAEINKQEGRSLERFDADFDLPDHLLPEFPPPVFLTTRPELGDVSRGQLLTIRNYFAILDGILTPVQMEGMRLLLTPFPQQQFNQTDDR